GESFSVFERDDFSELVDVLFQHILQLEEILNAFSSRSAAPRRKRRSCGLNSGIDFGGGGERRAREQLCGGGGRDAGKLGCGGAGPSAVNIVGDVGNLW